MAEAKILVIEDMANVRLALETALGDDVQTVADGEEAQRAFYRSRPDLVLLDV